jgi:dolichol-phosphate mannosyltransferase
LALDIILAFSIRPLKVAIILGVILSLISIGFGSSLVVKAYFGGFEIVGIPTLITTILFSTGIVLVFLGILGVYLGKVFEEVKNRPLYIIDTEINF